MVEKRMGRDGGILSLYDYTSDPEQTKRDNQMLLDSLGLDGWELVTVRKDLAYLKREFVGKKFDPVYVDNAQLAKMMMRD